ncbi:MAG: Clp protease N-terminal domain-containing protein [Pseudomonadota bacterium]
MLARLKQRIRDMSTIKALCLGAEKQAHLRGEDSPGAEHFLLSAIDLPDGTARRAFERLDANPDGLGAAITEQYKTALAGIGVDPASLDQNVREPVTSTHALFESKPSGQAIMQELAARKGGDKDKPLLSADVLEVIAAMQQGVAARALRAMGISPEALREAARYESKNFSA